jgi:molybdopterin synthase sulfur carrier subunit
MVTIRLYSLLRLLLKRETIDLPVALNETVGTLLQQIGGEAGATIAAKLFAAEGVLQTGTIILVNRHNILHLQGLATPVYDGDVVALFPPGAGG